MDAFTKLVTIFYSGFHKYLKEAGYDLFDLEFIDIYNKLKAIFKSSYSCKLHAMISHIWFHSWLFSSSFLECFDFCYKKIIMLLILIVFV